MATLTAFPPYGLWIPDPPRHIPPAALLKYAEVEIDSRQVPDIENHLDRCPKCVARLKSVSESGAILAAAFPSKKPSSDHPVVVPQTYISRLTSLLERFFASTRPKRPLGPRQILLWFAQDVGVTGVAFVLLVSATLLLQFCTQAFNDSSLYHTVLDFLEVSIFLSGSLVLFVVLLYVTGVTLTDLVKSFVVVVGITHPKAQGPNSGQTVDHPTSLNLSSSPNPRRDNR